MLRGRLFTALVIVLCSALSAVAQAPDVVWPQFRGVNACASQKFSVAACAGNSPTEPTAESRAPRPLCRYDCGTDDSYGAPAGS